jgi:hypothetical protein
LELVVISPRRLLTYGVERFSQLSRMSIDTVARNPSRRIRAPFPTISKTEGSVASIYILEAALKPGLRSDS